MSKNFDDYYYKERLKYKDDERLHKYIELSKMFDPHRITDKPCYDPETMLFTVYIYTNISFQGQSDFNCFNVEFFPELGNSWNYSPVHFMNTIFEACVREGLKQKSKRVYRLIDGL